MKSLLIFLQFRLFSKLYSTEMLCFTKFWISSGHKSTDLDFSKNWTYQILLSGFKNKPHNFNPLQSLLRYIDIQEISVTTPNDQTIQV